MAKAGKNRNDIRVLLDLKPALDGYAGIPQESRLLFHGLSTMNGYNIEGLIQHGGRRLRPAVSPAGKTAKNSRRIHQHSRMIVSLFEKSSYNIFETGADYANKYLAFLQLQLRKMTGFPIALSRFESEHFDDFIWRTFFSKTLQAAEKELISGARYRVLRQSRKMLHHAGLKGFNFFSGPRYPRINTRGFDVYVAQTPFPGRVSRRTAMVVRYHDAVPVLMPHTINDKAFHQAAHFYALRENVRAGAWFSCVSESTRNELLKIFPEAEPRTSVIHNIVAAEYFNEDSPRTLIFQIIRNRLSAEKNVTIDLKSHVSENGKRGGSDFPYLLMVSTIEPRKNHQLLISAWERLKYTSMPGLKLVVVGGHGWDKGPILDSFRPWEERGDLFHLSNVPSTELRVLYKHAAATLCPSIAEGFGYSGVEAMCCGGVVISSDIPVHREIYQNASGYFSPYSADDAAQVIQCVLSPEGKAMREQLRDRGRRISALYTPGNILPKWDEYFRKFKKE
ncbi:MAG: glycosyltransferase family 4 protein [Chlorobiales bacterium]|nr:glycosyltransferase family 4 protein [Chlorobiales bacterium]